MACQTWKFSSAIISAGNALQGPVNDWALLGFAGRSYANNLFRQSSLQAIIIWQWRSHLRQCPARPGHWPGLAGLCSKVWSLQARPGKAQSLTGPCRALPEGLRLIDLWAKSKVCHEMSFQDLPRFQTKTVIGIWIRLQVLIIMKTAWDLQ